MAASRQHSLSGLFRFTLFATSYTPLFGLIAFKQLNDNPDFLHWGGLSLAGLKIWVTNYLLSTILLILMALSIVGLIYFLRLLRQRTLDNGNPIRLVAVRNRNSEAIGYIGSYIIPFLFQSYKTLYENAATVLARSVVQTMKRASCGKGCLIGRLTADKEAGWRQLCHGCRRWRWRQR